MRDRIAQDKFDKDYDQLTPAQKRVVDEWIDYLHS